jgi:hypothetical protein
MGANDNNPDQMAQLPLSKRYPGLGPNAISWLYNRKNLDLTADLTDEQIQALAPLDHQKWWSPWRWAGLVLILFAISCMIFHKMEWSSIATVISLGCSMLPQILLERSCSRRFDEATDKKLLR